MGSRLKAVVAMRVLPQEVKRSGYLHITEGHEVEVATTGGSLEEKPTALVKAQQYCRSKIICRGICSMKRSGRDIHTP